MPKKKVYRKKYVTNYKPIPIESFSSCSLKTILKDVSILIDEYGEDAILDMDYGDWIEATVRFKRLETDKEFKKRIKKEEEEKRRISMIKKEQEKHERKLYERLKKKFGE